MPLPLQSDEQFSGLMDTLAAEAATGVHTTKKERSAVSTYVTTVAHYLADSYHDCIHPEKYVHVCTCIVVRESVTNFSLPE